MNENIAEVSQLKIGLVDADSHNWPNLCLMKLSAYHKARGDSVEWWKPEGQYTLVYKSRVFTDIYSQDTITVNNADEVICGGTGYGPGSNLPDAVEHTRPDYTLYPQFPCIVLMLSKELIYNRKIHRINKRR